MRILHEEYPYPYCYAGCDAAARGAEHFPVQFTHPLNGGDGAFNTRELDPKVCYFTREWGDNVDDWNSHNSPSRVNRGWGEVPMLIQAKGYARRTISIRATTLCGGRRASMWAGVSGTRSITSGATIPIPSTAGIMDAFRQPKYSYYMFCAQRPVQPNPS